LWSSADEDALDTDDRIDRLARRSLIQRTSADRYLLHDLQYDAATLRVGDNLLTAHRCLIDGYRQQLAAALSLPPLDGWGSLVGRLAGLPVTHPAWSVADDGYLLDQLITHLRAAGEQSSALELLGNYDWISLGVSRRVLGRILVDYEGLPAGNPLRLVRDALGRSARIVATDPSSLPDQLYGRLADAEDPALGPLLAQLRTKQASRPLQIIRSGLQPASGTLVHVLAGHEGIVLAVAVTRDGTRAVTGSVDHTAIVWDLATGTPIHTLRGHHDTVWAVAIAADDARAVTGSDDGTVIVWDLATGTAIHTLTGHSEAVRAVAVTRDGTRAVTGSDDKTVIVWDLETGVAIHTFAGDSRLWLYVSRDGKAIIATSDETIIEWDVATGAPMHAVTGHTRPVTAVAVTSDQSRAVTVGHDRTAIVWDLATGTVMHALIGHFDAGYSVAVTSDAARAVTGGNDPTAIVWDLATGTPLHILTSHRSAVHNVAVTSDDSRAVTGSEDGTVIVSDLATGTPLLELTGHRGGIRAIAVTPDDTVAVTGSNDYTAIVWDLSADTTSHKPVGRAMLETCGWPGWRCTFPVTESSLKQ
jgi:WD40 repeat protein